MKKERMSLFGIGHKAGIPTLIYLGLAWWLTKLYPNIFNYPNWDLVQAVRVPKGIFLLVAGGVILLFAAGHLVYAYIKNQLAKTGLYHLVANPLYANAVVFLIPGLSLILNSWLVLTASIVLYIIYRYFVPQEYENLKNLYGKEYEDYYKSILIKWL